MERGMLHLKRASFGIWLIERGKLRKKLRGLLHKRKKVRVFVWNGIRKNIISYYSSAFTINSTTTTPKCTLLYRLVSL